MPKTKTYPIRALVFDDNAEVLRRISNIIREHRIAISASEEVRIELHTVPVIFDHDLKALSHSTVEALLEAAKHDFEFIFSDFAFIIDQQKNEHLRDLLASERRGPRRGELDGIIKQLSDVKQYILNMSLLPLEQKCMINHRIFDHPRRVVIYTYSPFPFSQYFEGDECSQRKAEMKSVFPHACDIEIYPLHTDVPIDLSPLPSFKDPETRTVFIAKLLQLAVEKRLILAGVLLSFAQRSKERYRNVFFGSQFMMWVSVILGALTALGGDILYHAFHSWFTPTVKEENVWLMNPFVMFLLGLFCVTALGFIAVFVLRYTDRFVEASKDRIQLID